MAESRAPRSERERMLHRRARGFAPITKSRKRGKSPGGFDASPYRSVVGCQEMAEFRASCSDHERMLHLRARTFAPLSQNCKRGKTPGRFGIIPCRSAV